MYSPIFLRTENELNKVLKKQKRTKADLGVLFVSLWDRHSQELVKLLEEKDPPKRGRPLYIVDSFKMPHAFVIFHSTKLPHLVQFKRGSLDSEDYLSKIYEVLGV
tara:strand:+ start:159 stop:473 length:315 start_codon:yes stop_codon:yes gene_type:complete